MKFLLVLCLSGLALTGFAQTNQPPRTCRNPVRAFPGQATVNLAPLFDWWSQQPASQTNQNSEPDPSRPLPAWRLIDGTKVAIAGDSWVVDAMVYNSPSAHTNARVFLNHPPAVEEQSFYNLKSQLDTVGQQLAALNRTYRTETNAERQAMVRADEYRRSWDKNAPTGVIEYTRRAEKAHAAAAALLTQMDQLDRLRKQLEGQLKLIPAKGNAYRIHWFALEIGHTRAGLPIYDLGLVSPTPP